MALTISLPDLEDHLARKKFKFAKVYISDRPVGKMTLIDSFLDGFESEEGGEGEDIEIDYSPAFESITEWLEKGKYVCLKVDNKTDFKHCNTYMLSPQEYMYNTAPAVRPQSASGRVNGFAPVSRRAGINPEMAGYRDINEYIADKVSEEVERRENLANIEYLEAENARLKNGGQIGALLGNPFIQSLVTNLAANMIAPNLMPPPPRATMTGFNSSVTGHEETEDEEEGDEETTISAPAPAPSNPLRDVCNRLRVVISDTTEPITVEELIGYLERLATFGESNPVYFKQILKNI